MNKELDAETKKTKEIYKLWQECFGDSQEYIDYYMQWRGKKNSILTLYDGKMLASMLHLNPYKLFVNNREIKAHYIVGVATQIDHRKKGLMRTLLSKAFEKMYENGEEFSYLMPADKNIYLPFDFRYVYKQERLYIDLEERCYIDLEEELKVYRSRKDYRVEFLSQATTKEKKKRFDDIVEFTTNQLKNQFNIVTVRDNYYYQRLLEEMKSAGGDIVVILKGSEIVCYFPYMAEKNQVEIVECVVLKPYAQDIVASIPAIIGNEIFENNRDEVTLIASELAENKENRTDNNQIEKNKVVKNQAVNSLVEKENLKITFLETFFMNKEALKFSKDTYRLEEYPIIMARIIHFKNFIKNMTSIQAVTIYLEVKDNLIKQNEGVFKLAFSKSGCEVEETKREAELVLDIANLTSVLFGYLKLEDVLEQNNQRIEADVLDKWNLINKYNNIYINEIV